MFIKGAWVEKSVQTPQANTSLKPVVLNLCKLEALLRKCRLLAVTHFLIGEKYESNSFIAKSSGRPEQGRMVCTLQVPL